MVRPSTRQDASWERKFIPNTSILPIAGEMATFSPCASMPPSTIRSIVPVWAGTIPFAVHMTMGTKPLPLLTEASRAVSSEMVVTVAPLSINSLRSTPLISARAQKCPSGEMRT